MATLERLVLLQTKILHVLHAVIDVGIDGTTVFTIITGGLHVKWDQTYVWSNSIYLTI